MDINNLTFEEKTELLKLLIDDLDITLLAQYGEEGFISSKDVSILPNNKIEIWTGIMTG